MRCVRVVVSLSIVLALASGAGAQALPGASGMTFSVDFQGPSAAGPGPLSGLPGGFGITLIDEGSILTPTLPGLPGPNLPTFPPGPLPLPGVMVGSIPGAAGSILGGLGIVPEPLVGVIELDALSYGRDQGHELFFSVDEFAMGLPGLLPAPNVTSEGTFAGVFEASADVFAYLGPMGPIPPGAVFGNTAIIDGNALPSLSGAVYPGTGLIEPNAPTPGGLPDPGDNLDAVDIGTTLVDLSGPIYISLSSRFPDPLEPSPPTNGGTAAANGFVGGDVLVTFAGGFPALYAPAVLLGLDIAGGPDSDDLDALALLEDGDGIFTPGSDFILFSVRRGSAVIGSPDSMFGAPIEEGDVLTIPLPTPLGGLSPFPAIFVPGEALGLVTLRGFPAGGQFGADDLDALDIVVPEPCTLTLLALGGLAMMRRRRKTA